MLYTCVTHLVELPTQDTRLHVTLKTLACTRLGAQSSSGRSAVARVEGRLESKGSERLESAYLNLRVTPHAPA